MASEYIERARRGYDALNRTRDADSILSELDPDVEIILPWDALDFAGVVFHGHQGVRDVLGTLMDAWSETRFEPLELIDGGDRVLAICRQRSRGLHTDLEVDQVVAHLWSVGKNGKFKASRDLLRPGGGS